MHGIVGAEVIILKVAVFHGSPRKGNTYIATRIFLDELAKHEDVDYTEFFFPAALPVFCTGCQLCLAGPREACPHARYITPLYETIMACDALIFTTPHLGGCSMSSCMKNLLDHLDFFTLNVAPRAEMFHKRAWIITTATGSTAAIKPIRRFLKNWGINRVGATGLRMLTNRWNAMPGARQAAFKKRLQAAARRFYAAPIKRPYVSTISMYYLSRFILKKYVGEGAYPYRYWQENGFFRRRPF